MGPNRRAALSARARRSADQPSTAVSELTNPAKWLIESGPSHFALPPGM